VHRAPCICERSNDRRPVGQGGHQMPK
jgi:hypothetical protein